MSARADGPPSWWDWLAVGATATSTGLLVAAIVLFASGRWPLGGVALTLAGAFAVVPLVLVRRFTREQRAARERMWRRLVDDLAAAGRPVEPVAAPRPRFRLVRGHRADVNDPGDDQQHGMRRQA